jgi:ACS family tartrate transporter-like MFS transporter
MMFVRTPLEFNILRFLLGVAEAGFFPGVIYYLTIWFPARRRARAVSRFYIAMPLSSVVMGSVAGWLLGMGGKLGLAGWQWLFLLEGLPAVVFSFVMLRLLPDGPEKAAWLTEEEKVWLKNELKNEGDRAHLGHHAGIMQALLSPKVWMMGAFFLCVLTANYAYGFSAPAILQDATGWSVTHVGYLVACLGLAGAAAMLIGGAHSDRTGERAFHCIVPCVIMAACFITASYARTPWIVVTALGLSFISFQSMQGPALTVPTQFLAGRAAAAGIATMNMITMFSGFIGPNWMGIMKDSTGSYQAGLRGLALPSLAAAAIMFVLTQSLKRAVPSPLLQAGEFAD